VNIQIVFITCKWGRHNGSDSVVMPQLIECLLIYLLFISINYLQGNINDHCEIYIQQKVHSR